MRSPRYSGLWSVIRSKIAQTASAITAVTEAIQHHYTVWPASPAAVIVCTDV